MNEKTGAGPTKDVVEPANTHFGPAERGKLVNLELSRVHPDPDQPRKHFDEQHIEELANSIADHGLLQPITVVQEEGGDYRIVTGGCRFLAHQKLGRKTILALITDDVDRERARLIENLQRRDLTALEQARALRQLQQKRNLTHEDLARTINKDRSYVSKMLSINNLVGPIQEDCATSHNVEAGVLIELVKLDPEEQIEIWPHVRNKEIGVRELRAMKARKTYQEKSEVSHAMNAVKKTTKWLKKINPSHLSGEERQALLAQRHELTRAFDEVLGGDS